MNKIKKAIVVASSFAAPAVLLADETPVDASSVASSVQQAVTPYITQAATVMVAIFTAGAVIVGGMFIWRVLKKALGSSK